MASSFVSMQQIADDLALNRATVSLVINGHAQKRFVSEKTVKRVNGYLKKVGYVASRGAVALRSGKCSDIGILHSGHLYTHLIQAFNQLTDEFSDSQQGMEIVIRSSDAILDGLREMVSRGVKRMIWIHGGGMGSIAQEIREEAITLGGRLHTVIYNYAFDMAENDKEMVARGFSLIGISRRSGYLQMARFLKNQGHRYVLLADVPAGSSRLLDVQFLEAMRSRGIEAQLASWPAPETSNLVDHGKNIGRIVAHKLKKNPYSAICFRDDEVAGGAIAALIARGVHVPNDVAVISMDGHPLSGIFQTPLTTLAVPVETMVQKTIMLIRQNALPGAFLFPYKMIQRTSHLRTDASSRPI